jgi:hypothetical protein
LSDDEKLSEFAVDMEEDEFHATEQSQALLKMMKHRLELTNCPELLSSQSEFVI